ncbi:MAG: galactonate dehydratase [Thermomicrobiales bacterium]|jgi:galactonate dehydratase|nr:galactonate dehydratase [Thermomicrobiales bacterium]MEA2524542.1 galactonate dehydratase [Thermomicrobiales bacterium]MEA2586519.1 galactonate dehydratase [Thermomicrobiales bacterium]
MKITQITSYGCKANQSNYVFVRIDTDEGISGVGEATLESKELSVLGAIEECKRLLIGKNPLDIELNWVTMNRYAPWKGAALFSAMSGLEHAMWDIAGKAANLPVYRLLGGPVRDSIPAYTWPSPYTNPQELAEAALYARETYGYNNFKIDPFTSYFTVSAEEITYLEQCMAAMRDALGPSAGIAVDGHWRFNPPAAVRIAKAIEPFNPLFFEEPCLSDNDEALATVRRMTTVPLATGERGYTRWAFWNMLKHGLVDIIQPDLCHAGGILETRKIAAMAETTGVMVAPHNPNGPVSLAATVHFAACTPNFLITESVHTRNDVAHQVVKEPLQVVNGAIPLPTAPGLGVELDYDAIAKIPMEPRELMTGSKVVI